MARRRKKDGHEGHGNMERWLLTYADMITLLMAFFIMMYSMSVLNMAKFNQAAFSIRSGFGGVLKDDKHLLRYESGKGISSIAHIQTNATPLKDVEQRLTSYTIVGGLEDKMVVSREKRGVVVSIAADNLLFNKGSAEIQPTAFPILTEVARNLKMTPNQVMVEGHTCPLPISTAVFPSNWELSAARASSVVRFLVMHGVPPMHLMAAGYGDTQPRVPNDTELHRSMNRRVDVVILNSDQESPSSVEERIEEAPEEALGVSRHVRPHLIKVWQPGEQPGGGIQP